MFYKSVAEIIALFRRDDLPESHLHFFLLLDPVHKTDPVRQADTVGISDDRRFPEYLSLIHISLQIWMMCILVIPGKI